ncbi:MAG: YceI family protein [Candidatus Neomarinimicrobiota bacterium]|jgi:polyisoprenoid-binding protein YceI
MNKRSFFIITLLAILVGCSKESTSKKTAKNNITLESGNYNVKPLTSTVDWVGKELSTKTHTGTLEILEGDIRIEPSGKIEGYVKIDMQTIVVTDLKGGSKQKLEGHLKSKDFFGVQDHPTAVITFTGNTKDVIGNTLKVVGDLEIKNISHPITFDTEIQADSNNITVAASMSFDRSKYDVRYRSGTFFKDLGDKLILNDIDVNTNIVASKN